jgi:tRNA threonylcarbamoyladenosine biosynthesis protein TsaB
LLVLAIDTTARKGGFALVRDDEVVASRIVESERGLASLLFAEVERLLIEAGVSLEHVEGFAALSGPGSFTGIRVGLTAAKALGEVGGKPVLAVSNLEALAFAGEGAVRAAVLPGRRGDVFGAVFDAELGVLVAERLETAEAFFARAHELGAAFVTSDAGLETPLARIKTLAGPLAEAAGRLACQRLASGVDGRPETVDATYVERPAMEGGQTGP